MFQVYEGTRHGKPMANTRQDIAQTDKHNKPLTQDITKARNYKLFLYFRTFEGTMTHTTQTNTRHYKLLYRQTVNITKLEYNKH